MYLIPSCNKKKGNNLVIDHGAKNSQGIHSSFISGLPFGSSILINFKLPAGWEDPLEDNSGNATNLNAKQYRKISMFYRTLNRVKSKQLPFIKTVKNIRIGKDSLITQYKEQDRSATFEYQLPDFGPYQCFYQYDAGVNFITKDQRQYLQCGNLILYEPKSKEAKILQVYNEYIYGGETVSNYQRYFYIDKNKKITIFEVELDELEGGIEKTQEITVSNDGLIKIKNL